MARALGLVLAIFALLCQTGEASRSHCGGIGPTPLTDISSTLKYHVQTLDAVAGVKEFLYQETSNSVIYRNTNDEIRGLAFSQSTGDYASTTLLSTSVYPLSRVVDPTETFVLTDGYGWMLNEKDQTWAEFSTLTNLQELYWSGDTIYSLATNLQTNGNTEYDFYSYEVGGDYQRKLCSVTSTASAPYTLAEGHEYPYVFFYRDQIISGSDREALVYAYDLSSCTMGSPTQYSNIKGPVKSVYRFDSIDSTAVVFDSPTENLLWDGAGGCQFYEIDNESPIVPNFNQPVVATFTAGQGVTVYFLTTQNKATFLKGLPVNELNQGDLWLTDSGRKLFLAPLFNGERYHWLLNLNLAANQNNDGLTGLKPTR